MKKFHFKNIDGEKPNIMKSIASIIISGRFIIYAVFLAACIFCALSVNKVKINYDLTTFLPDSTETRQGLSIMESEFTTYATAEIMVSNITYDCAADLADSVKDIPNVFSVVFDDSDAHYTSSSALFAVTFSGEEEDENVISAMTQIKTLLDGYDVYIDSEVGDDFYTELAGQMVIVMLLAVLVIVAVLLFTSRSYFEVVIFAIVFAVAALLNMGTNYFLGTISQITNMVAIILQLALAIDYAIIFSHRYQDETANFPTAREALVESLSKAIPEISSSSLTTIAGLVALTFMQFGLGYDMGIVLAKGIVCSLLTVFLLMPGLIMLFPKAISKTQHKNLVPSIRPWGNFLVKSKFLFVAIFILIIPPAIIFSNKLVYAFSEDGITELAASTSSIAQKKIDDTFNRDTYIAVIVPKENLQAEKEILEQVAELENVNSVTGLANIEIDDGHVLTDSYTPRMFSELLNIDIEQAKLIYDLYGVENKQYQAILGDSDSYSVPLIDMFLFLFDKIDTGLITLDDEQLETINSLRSTLDGGIVQLRGTDHNRMVISANVPKEGDESVELVEKIRDIAQSYYDSDVLVIGEITSARDLSETYNSDSFKISIITIIFVFIILMLTFRSFVGSALMVFIIQGSIWINFAIPYLQGFKTAFVTYMIVSSIQMGATIDYAIVIMNRYLALRATKPKKEAMAQTVDESFATIITSGAIMAAAGLLIAYNVSQVYVSHIGLFVGRGAIISVILVLIVLPQAIVLLDTPIRKSKIGKKLITMEQLKKMVEETENE